MTIPRMLLSLGTLVQGEETCSKEGPLGGETLGRGFLFLEFHGSQSKL